MKMATVYRIKTHTDKQLLFDSHHPLIHKNDITRTLFNTAERFCNINVEKIEEELHITTTLKEEGN